MKISDIDFRERQELAMAIAKSVSDDPMSRRSAYIRISSVLHTGHNSVELGVGGGYIDQKVCDELYYGCTKE